MFKNGLIKYNLPIFLILISCNIRTVYACLCINLSPKQRVKIAKKEDDAIFLGTVRSVAKEFVSAYTISFAVTADWKSDNVTEYTIYTSGGCRSRFEEDKSYLVYAVYDKNKQLITNVCMGTRLEKFANKEIKLLGKPLYKSPVLKTNYLSWRLPALAAQQENLLEFMIF